MPATRSPNARLARLARVALPAATLVGVFGAAACSHSPDATTASATGTRTTDRSGSIVLAPGEQTTTTESSDTNSTNAPVVTDPTPTAPKAPPTTARSGSGSGSGSDSSTKPAITSIHGPGTVDCQDGSTSMVTITVTYTAVNAKNVEYLSPEATRPGADAATGSVMFNYNCAKASEVFKIRAFNEFNGSDSKDPSPYVSVTVNRHVVGGTSSSSTTTSTAHPSTTVVVTTTQP